MKTPLSISVREFALPIPRLGSIESQSGYRRATLDGQEIHLIVQEMRSKLDPDYQAEVKMSHEFERGGFLFQVGGRMDGLFNHSTPKIEEIKTTQNIGELARKLSDDQNFHPYCLQLKTYGYFYWLQKGVLPELTFHLVSTRNRETDDIKVKLDIAHYEGWMEQRLNELVEEAQNCLKRAERRRKIVQKFEFPFENPRKGQRELIATLEEGLVNRKRMLLQAPTGLGKTVGVLYPALKEALARGQNVIYVTPKNSQHSVAEDAIQRFQDTGAKLKSLTITAKSKICFKNEPLCNPEYCEFAKDYYEKVHENQLKLVLSRKKKLDARVFRDIGEEFQVCPFELQLEAAAEADTIICDYNYAFAPMGFLDRIQTLPVEQEGKPNLVIDEAHNLPSRAMDYYSPALSSIALEKMREDIRKLPSRFVPDAEDLLDQCIQVILDCQPKESKKPEKIELSSDPFLDQDLLLKKFLSRYLDDLSNDIRPKDVVLRLCFYWAEFTSALDFACDPTRTEFFVTYHPHSSGGTLKITCCDASAQLESCYSQYENVVGFSATLKPFDYYAKLSGLVSGSLETAEFQTPFQRENRKLLIIPQISTRYSDRERNYSKIAEVITRISGLKRGNYFVFFPSFQFLERVAEIFQAPEDFAVLMQEREMKSPDAEKVLNYLKDRTTPTIVFAVQGGIFSEGIDYPGEMIIGAFVIGPPLPNFDLEREEMRKYYENHYKAGFDYAYAFPAMAKAVQAAGRVIRTETDRGLIVLLDQRFLQKSYTQSMPTDWFEKSPMELVSQSILKEISDFWKG